MNKNTLAAIILALTVFTFFVMVLPQYDAIKSVNEAIDLRQVMLNERTAEANKVNELNGQVKSRQSDINKIKSFLPEHKQTDELVSSFQNISETSGMQLVSMTVADTTGLEETKYKKMLVGVELTGLYPSFLNFLKLVEQSLRLYDIYEVNVALSTVSASAGNINFAIKLNAYYLK